MLVQLNAWADGFIRWGAHFQRQKRLFARFAWLGWGLGSLVMLLVSFSQALPLLLPLVLSVCCLLGFGLGRWLFAQLDQQHVYLRYLGLITLLSLLVTYFLKLPLGDALNMLALGALFGQAVGRLGCCQVGCCHGRPARWGFRYATVHSWFGFPKAWVGLRLYPVQLLESLGLWLLGILTWVYFARFAPAAAFVTYVLAYGCLRFLLEFWRGDAERPVLWRMSEAQWTIVLLTAISLGIALSLEWEDMSGAALLLLLLYGGLGFWQSQKSTYLPASDQQRLSRILRLALKPAAGAEPQPHQLPGGYLLSSERAATGSLYLFCRIPVIR